VGLSAAFSVLGVALVSEWVTGSDSHLWDATVLGEILVVQLIVIVVAMWRIAILRDVYTMGYRHGRHDANKSLLEAGLWLSEEAERDAQKNLEDE
jgi:hypothetical protein